MTRAKKKTRQPDPVSAEHIARAMVSLKLNPGNPSDWVTAVRQAGSGHPSQATIEAAVQEFKRITSQGPFLVRRDAHHLRRRR